jgi:hypothetical protein
VGKAVSWVRATAKALLVWACFWGFVSAVFWLVMAHHAIWIVAGAGVAMFIVTVIAMHDKSLGWRD